MATIMPLATTTGYQNLSLVSFDDSLSRLNISALILSRLPYPYLLLSSLFFLVRAAIPSPPVSQRVTFSSLLVNK